MPRSRPRSTGRRSHPPKLKRRVPHSVLRASLPRQVAGARPRQSRARLHHELRRPAESRSPVQSGEASGWRGVGPSVLRMHGHGSDSKRAAAISSEYGITEANGCPGVLAHSVASGPVAAQYDSVRARSATWARERAANPTREAAGMAIHEETVAHAPMARPQPTAPRGTHIRQIPRRGARRACGKPARVTRTAWQAGRACAGARRCDHDIADVHVRSSPRAYAEPGRR